MNVELLMAGWRQNMMGKEFNLEKLIFINTNIWGMKIITNHDRTCVCECCWVDKNMSPEESWQRMWRANKVWWWVYVNIFYKQGVGWKNGYKRKRCVTFNDKSQKRSMESNWQSLWIVGEKFRMWKRGWEMGVFEGVWFNFRKICCVSLIEASSRGCNGKRKRYLWATVPKLNWATYNVRRYY